MLQFSIQLLFLCFLLYFYISGVEIILDYKVSYTVLILLHLAILSFGVGTLVSSLCSKYKDLH